MEAPEKIWINPPIDLPKLNGVIDKDSIQYIRTDSFINKAKEAFCKATCNGHPPRSTCTSLGTCKEYDNFVKLLKRG